MPGRRKRRPHTLRDSLQHEGGGRLAGVACSVQALATFADRRAITSQSRVFGTVYDDPTVRETDLFEAYLSEWDEAAARRGAQAQRWADGVENGKRSAAYGLSRR